MVSLSRKEADVLQLEVHCLLYWDLSAGHPCRLKVDAQTENLLYSLDGLEFSTKVFKRTPDNVPPDVFHCPVTGYPLRPLYIDLSDGVIKRAVPISWNEGVDYQKWRTIKEASRVKND